MLARRTAPRARVNVPQTPESRPIRPHRRQGHRTAGQGAACSEADFGRSAVRTQFGTRNLKFQIGSTPGGGSSKAFPSFTLYPLPFTLNPFTADGRFNHGNAEARGSLGARLPRLARELITRHQTLNKRPQTQGAFSAEGRPPGGRRSSCRTFRVRPGARLRRSVRPPGGPRPGG